MNSSRWCPRRHQQVEHDFAVEEFRIHTGEQRFIRRAAESRSFRSSSTVDAMRGIDSMDLMAQIRESSARMIPEMAGEIEIALD